MKRTIAEINERIKKGKVVVLTAEEAVELVRTLNKYIEDRQLESPESRSAAAVAVLRQGTVVLRELSATLGLFLQPVEVAGGSDDQFVAGVMDLLIQLRAAAREKKNFEVADRIREGLGPLSITLEDRAGETDWSSTQQSDDTLAGLMQLVIELRANARANKDFDTADKIRDALNALKIELEDRPDGTEWSV